MNARPHFNALIPPGRVVPALLAAICAFASPLLGGETDVYGGARAIKGTATGWFHLEQLRGRWFFVTPDGHAYIPIGVNHLATYLGLGNNRPQPGERDFVRERHEGDLRRAAERVEASLRAWGFNFAGYDCPPQFRQTLPFAVGFQQTATSGVIVHGKPRYVDVFASEFAADLDRRVAAICSPLKQNRHLLGYYLVDLPLWGDRPYLENLERAHGESWLSFFRRLPPDSPGGLAYAQALRDMPDRAAAEMAFLSGIAEQSYRLTAEAFRRHDPNHLLLGERFAGPRLHLPVLERAAKYFPVIAIQVDGDFDPAFFGEVHRRTGRPIVNVDHVGNFPTPATPVVMGRPLPNEAAAAAQYARYLPAAFSQPYMIGYSRCQFASRLRPGQGAPSWKQGLLAPDGEPYSGLIEAIVATNRGVLERLYRP